MSGNKAAGMNFCIVGKAPGEGHLTDVKISGYSYPEDYDSDDAFVGVITASKLNEFGNTVKDKTTGALAMWDWVDWIEEDVPVCGWMDGEGLWVGSDVADVPLAMGEGLWVASDSAKWQFVFPSSL